MISSGWLQDFKGTPEEREKLIQSIQGSSYVLNILSEWIERQLQDLQNVKRDDYENPNWGLLTAHKNGEIRALTNVLKLTKLERNTKI